MIKLDKKEELKEMVHLCKSNFLYKIVIGVLPLLKGVDGQNFVQIKAVLMMVFKRKVWFVFSEDLGTFVCLLEQVPKLKAKLKQEALEEVKKLF